ncbi:serine/threonine-protein kinase [Nocardioides solisilvae]|uniref:serine/threonine-protein kinase n=1 Tax=Nocardioides solisilvae TaxID=1542435 RepID=UPI000D748B0E|nr:serine/threonine-protein kinase [Nocardioides solisilvae]
MSAGKYVREREIGRGGMGTVWLGRDTVLGRAVAMKRVGVVPGGSAPDLERAEREARLAAALSHPHVVAVFDLVAEGDEHWLVMEHVQGDSLATRIRRDGPLDLESAASVVGQVADALSAAHDHGIVHRDVKPSNILVTDEGQAKLTDFGIARAEADASLTQTGLVTGSPAYLSPEVASGSSATSASDVWALGATLYHALAGRPPYDVGDNVLGALYQIVHEEPPRLADAGWLSPVLEHTMATDPGDRWDAARVRDFLGDPASREVAPAPPAHPEGPAGTPTAVLPTERTSAFPPVAGGPTPAASSSGGTADGTGGTAGGTAGGASAQAPASTSAPLLWALAGALVLAMVAGGFWLGLRDGRDSPGTESGGSPSAGSGSSSAPADPTPTQSPSSTPSPTPSSTPSPSPSVPDAAAMEAFVSGYLDTVTTDPQATWQQLTPAFQRRSGGFDSYSGFWSTISDVTLLDVTADPERSTVTYRVRYDLAAGGRTTDTVTLLLEPDEDGFQVAGES